MLPQPQGPTLLFPTLHWPHAPYCWGVAHFPRYPHPLLVCPPLYAAELSSAAPFGARAVLLALPFLPPMLPLFLLQPSMRLRYGTHTPPSHVIASAACPCPSPGRGLLCSFPLYHISAAVCRSSSTGTAPESSLWLKSNTSDQLLYVSLSPDKVGMLGKLSGCLKPLDTLCICLCCPHLTLPRAAACCSASCIICWALSGSG